MADRKMKHITSDVALAVRGANVVFRYIFLGAICFVIFLLTILPGQAAAENGMWFIMLLLMLFPFAVVIYLEYDTIRLRKKYGLSLWKGVYWQMKDIIDEELGNVPMKDGSIDKDKDLNYWFELKEKGAISEEEYEAKKKLIMGK